MFSVVMPFHQICLLFWHPFSILKIKLLTFLSMLCWNLCVKWGSRLFVLFSHKRRQELIWPFSRFRASGCRGQVCPRIIYFELLPCLARNWLMSERKRKCLVSSWRDLYIIPLIPRLLVLLVLHSYCPLACWYCFVFFFFFSSVCWSNHCSIVHAFSCKLLW